MPAVRALGTHAGRPARGGRGARGGSVRNLLGGPIVGCLRPTMGEHAWQSGCPLCRAPIFLAARPQPAAGPSLPPLIPASPPPLPPVAIAAPRDPDTLAPAAPQLRPGPHGHARWAGGGHRRSTPGASA
eukprot:1183942-Prorocentrum_minimum.AAC.2